MLLDRLLFRGEDGSMSRAESRPRRPNGLINRVLAFIFGPTPLMRRPGRSRNRISRGDDRRA